MLFSASAWIDKGLGNLVRGQFMRSLREINLKNEKFACYSIGNAVYACQRLRSRSAFVSMSLLILFLLALMLLWRRPSLVWQLPENGACLSHNRTNLINAFFIVIIVLRHINQRIVPFEGIDLWYQRLFDGPAGQSIVSSFFFFSGYGIFKAIERKRETYVKELITKRFLRLYINMGICCAFSCMAYLITHLTPKEALVSFVDTMIGAGSYWFIVMTLAIYLVTWFGFKVCGVNRPLSAILLSFALIYVLCVALIPIKPMWWLDTELCFPCGMLMALFLPKVENAVRKIRVPVLLVGAVCLAAGWILMKYHMMPYYVVKEKFGLLEWLPVAWHHLLRDAYHILLYPLCTVVFVLGVLWLFAGIKWKKEPSFLVWLGGPAVFYIFVLHFIPIRIIQAGSLVGPYPIMSSDIGSAIVCEPMGSVYPELSIVGMMAATLLLAYGSQIVVSRIDGWIFNSKK